MKNASILLLFLSLFTLNSCNWFARKTKETVHKSGEIVSKTGSEFIDGVSKGIEKANKNQVVISQELTKLGIKTGKIDISSSEENQDDILSIYFIFDNAIDKKIEIKIFDDKNQEYGRISQKLIGKKGEAKYVDFQFDKRTNIAGKGKIVIN